MTNQQGAKTKLVRHFRQILLWPLQLMPAHEGAQIQKHWESLDKADARSPWREVGDKFTGDPTQFQERHHSEFVSFLPYVQRFLYGEGKSQGGSGCDSPVHVFRRNDVAQVRMTFPGRSANPVTFDVAHVDLHFFYDIDVVILAVEIHAGDLNLDTVQETLFRFGRAYPAHWKPDGDAGNCLERAEWLSADGTVLAVSDYEKREKYLSFVCQHRAPCVSSHWEFLLKPLVPHHSDEKEVLRYRQLEYYRMPLLAYLAMDDARTLVRADFVRLGLVTAPGTSEALPYSERSVRDFEDRYCYDRYWHGQGADRPGTRFISCGHAFVMVGDHSQRFFTDCDNGMLGQFRHKYFLLFLIPHFHKAALLMITDRLVEAMNKLDIQSPDSVRRFKQAIRTSLETFLRFTHHYWFHEVPDQPEAKELFRMSAEYVGTDRLYREVREEIEDMNDYLAGDSLRRQGNAMVRLTVVATFGLIGAVVTGYFGWNLFALGDGAISDRLIHLVVISILTTLLLFYTLAKSERLADFLDAISDERLSAKAKFWALIDVWRVKRGRRS